MLKTTLKGLFTHKLRFALTTFAIVIGVAFVSGVFVLTDTLGNVFDDLFAEVLGDIDVSIEAATSEGFDDPAQSALFPVAALDEVLAVDGVEAAEGWVGGNAAFRSPDGEEIVSTGAPIFVQNWVATPGLTPFTMTQGEPPGAAREVVIDQGTADEFEITVGESMGVASMLPLEDFEVVGIARFGEEASFAGARAAFLTLEETHRITGLEDQLNGIDVIGAAGVSRETLRDDVQDALGDEFDVVTGDEALEEVTDTIREQLSFFNTFLLVFAFIALFVATFLIVNTFSIIVTQRSRELALLRALGATGAQVRGSVILEAVIVGLVASVIGLFGGILLAVLLRSAISAFGVELPQSGLVIALRTVVVAFVVGVTVTVVAAILPAVRASRIAPVAAMRGEGSATRRSGVTRAVGGGVLTVLGAALLLYGLFGGAANGILFVGLGAVLVFVGVAVLGPFVVRPVVAVFGAPFRRSVSGGLGVENAQRNPRRTSSTAAALMVGLGLAVFTVVFSQSIKASADTAIDEAFKADFLMQAGGAGAGPPTPFSTEVAPELAGIEGVAVATGLRGRLGQFGDQAPWRLDGEDKLLYGADFAVIEETTTMDVVEGEVSSDRPGLVVHEDQAEDYGWSIGDTVAMEFPTGTREVTVQAIYADNRLAGDFAIDTALYDEVYPDPMDVLAFVVLDEGADAGAVRTDVEGVLAGYPGLTVQDQTELKEQNQEQINQLLGLVAVLLVLSVGISVLGIVNTLGLSVIERTREIGLLRAVGTTRKQVRRMITVESLQVALLGALLGLALGTVFSWAVVRALADEGLGEFTFPIVWIVVFFLVAAVVGVGAAVYPAWRATKVDVLDAVTTE